MTNVTYIKHCMKLEITPFPTKPYPIPILPIKNLPSPFHHQWCQSIIDNNGQVLTGERFVLCWPCSYRKGCRDPKEPSSLYKRITMQSLQYHQYHGYHILHPEIQTVLFHLPEPCICHICLDEASQQQDLAHSMSSLTTKISKITQKSWKEVQ